MLQCAALSDGLHPRPRPTQPCQSLAGTHLHEGLPAKAPLLFGAEVALDDNPHHADPSLTGIGNNAKRNLAGFERLP